MQAVKMHTTPYNLNAPLVENLELKKQELDQYLSTFAQDISDHKTFGRIKSSLVDLLAPSLPQNAEIKVRQDRQSWRNSLTLLFDIALSQAWEQGKIARSKELER